MENKINLNQKLGEVVSIFPKATETFNKYKIDYCCGGHDTLEAALKAEALDVPAILEKLNSDYEEFLKVDTSYKDWRKETPTALIAHILNTHHDFTKKQLKEIDTLLFKVLKVHFAHHSEELLNVHKLFGSLKTELEEHLIKEEEQLFPLMEEWTLTKEENILNQIKLYIDTTESEHDAAGNILKELAQITRDFEAPEGACTSFKLVYTKLHELEKDLFVHIYLENSVLFEMIK